MKKSLIIIILTLLQCACSAQKALPGGKTPLLSFEAISAEITVTCVETGPAANLFQTVALNTE
jgi:hypothetical protein